MTAPLPAVYQPGIGAVSADNLNTFIQGVLNFAQLRTFTGLSNMAVNVLGGVSANDGNQGLFYYSDTSTATDNGSTVIVPNGALVGAWLRLQTATTSASYVPAVNNNAALSALPHTFSPIVMRLGYATPGDSPVVFYIASASAPTINSGAGDGGSQIPSSDGGSWQLSYPPSGLTPKIWGAAGNATTDDSAPIKAMFAYLTLLSTAANFEFISQFTVELCGATFATSTPLVLPSYTVLRNGQFKGLAGSNWITSAAVTLNGISSTVTFSSAGTAILQANNPGFLTLENIGIDCNRIANCQGFLGASGENYNNLLDNVTIRHWKSGGNGMIFANGYAAEVRTPNINQFVFGDAEYGAYANYSGIGLGFFETFDSIIRGGNFSDTGLPIFVDPGSTALTFDGCHPYQSVSSITTDPPGFLYLGYDCLISNTYLDKCVILMPIAASYTNSSTPQVQITGTQALWQAGGGSPTITAWIQFNTSITNTPIYSINIRNNNFAAGSFAAFKFATNSGGSWAMTTKTLAAVNGAFGFPDFTGNAIGGGTVSFVPSINMMGLSYLTGQLNQVNSFIPGGNAYTFSADDAGTAINFVPTNTLTLTANNTLLTASSFTCTFRISNYGGTIQCASGSINGLTTAITLTANYMYILTLFVGTGTNAAYGLIGHGV